MKQLHDNQERVRADREMAQQALQELQREEVRQRKEAAARKVEEAARLVAEER